MAHVVVMEFGDLRRLQELFGRDPVVNAYQCGSLLPGYREQTMHLALIEEEQPRAVLTLYRGLSVPALFTWGQPDAVSRLAERVQATLPRRLLWHRYPDHAGALDPVLTPRSVRRKTRMTLGRGGFRPQAVTAPVVPLTHAHTAEIVGLFDNYPDSFFEPYQLESGLYFGIREGDRLLSAAGIHLLSEELRFAMLGNVVTVPDARSRGYARQVTSRVCQALFGKVDLLALDVPLGSTAANAAFERLGFAPAFNYEQVLGDRR